MALRVENAFIDLQDKFKEKRFDWFDDPLVDRPEEVSAAKRPATDRRKQLIELYWLKLNSPTQLMYHLGYSSPEAVLEDIKKFDIPTRVSDQTKVSKEVLKQYNDGDRLWGTRLDSDAKTITSESLECKDFRQFQLYVKLNKTGSPDYSYVRIKVQFSLDGSDWHDLLDYPFGQLYEVEADTPASWAKTGVVGGNYMRIQFISYLGGTLDTTNYFIIYEVNVVFS